MKRRKVLTDENSRAAICMSILCLVTAARAVTDDFTFVIMSDRTGGANQPVFERAVSEIALLHPDFVVTVGDLIEGYAATDVRAKQWDEMMQLMKQVDCPVITHRQPRHRRPRVGAAVLRQDRAAALLLVRQGLVALHRAQHRAVRCVRPGRPVAAPLAWSRTAAQPDEIHIFVFMHKTFWLTGTAPDPGNDPMHQLFKKYHVTAVFCWPRPTAMSAR